MELVSGGGRGGTEGMDETRVDEQFGGRPGVAEIKGTENQVERLNYNLCRGEMD